MFDLGNGWGSLAGFYRRLLRVFSLQVASRIDVGDIDCHLEYNGKSVI